jgi:hypothetical protein
VAKEPSPARASHERVVTSSMGGAHAVDAGLVVDEDFEIPSRAHDDSAKIDSSITPDDERKRCKMQRSPMASPEFG